MKINVFTLIFVLFNFATIAQSNWSFMQGGSLSISDNKKRFFTILDTPSTPFVASSKFQAIGYNITFIPSYHFVKKPEISRGKRTSRKAEPEMGFDFSLGLPVSIGFNTYIGGNGGGSAIAYFYSLGAIGNINFGNCKLNGTESIGGFLGLGLAVTNTNMISPPAIVPEPNESVSSSYKVYSSVSDFNKNYKPTALGIGPVLNAGFQFENPFRPGSASTIYGSYLLAANNYGKNYLTIGVMYSGNLNNNQF
jgi:hypothetical protein